MKKIIFTFVMLFGVCSFAQVGINTTTPNTSSILDVSSTTKGFLQPRMSTVQRIAIALPATGLQVYDTTTNSNWYFNGTVWVQSASVNNTWNLDGNTNGAIKKFGTTDAFDIPFITSNTEKMRILQNGNIGIGTALPTAKLEVAGQIKTTNFQMTNGATANYVLKSNASGNASWTENLPSLLKTYSATAAIATPLTQNVTGSLIYSQNSGFPVFPENLPDGFTCTIVNYSIFANTSNTLTTAKFVTQASGSSGASSFTMVPGQTVNVYVITDTDTFQKKYFIK